MLQKLTATWLLILVTVIAGAQSISLREADSVLFSLSKPLSDSARIDMWLTIAQFHIFKPGENSIDFDSANMFIAKATSLNSIVGSKSVGGYTQLIGFYILKEKGKKDQAMLETMKAVKLMEAGNNKSYLGKGYFELSTYYNFENKEEFTTRINLVKKAIDAYQDGGNLSAKAFTLVALADLYNINDNIQAATEAALEALKVYQSIGYKKLQSLYCLLGDCYRGQENFRLALKYELQALNIAEQEKDSTMQFCQIQYVVGCIYKALDQRDNAIEHFKKALEVSLSHKDNYSIMIAMNLASTLTNSNKPTEALQFLKSAPLKTLQPQTIYEKIYRNISYLVVYNSMKEYANAEPFASELLALLNKQDLYKDVKSNVLRLLFIYFINIHKYALAESMLKQNDQLIFSAPAIYAAENARLWYKLDSAKGNFKSAFNHLLLYKTISDSVFTVTKARQLQQVEVEYETTKKEEAIKLKDKDILLLKQKNSLQQTNLNQAKTIKNITAFGIILTLGVTALIFFQYHQKKKTNILISSKNEQLQHLLAEKEWLLKEIHHRVKNNFQTVMGLLGTQANYLKNDEAVNAINDSQRRIQAMSLIHQRLYQSSNLSAINMADYVYELVDMLRESFPEADKFDVIKDIENTELGLNLCIPLGLIINEAVTNAVKYAFVDGRHGIINIILGHSAPGRSTLQINDNGIGLPRTMNIDHSSSMGMNLMRGLSKEIGATFNITNTGEGTSITVSFDDIASEQIYIS